MPKCIANCSDRAVYGKNAHKPIHCSKHRKSGEYNVTAKTCQHAGCHIGPVFNKVGETIGLYCKAHADPDMVNVKGKTCQHAGCHIQPTFNKVGESIGLYCKEHADPDMVDVKHTTCQHAGCRTRPTFNKVGGTIGLYCKAHSDPDMVDVKSKTCQYPDCSKHAWYGVPGRQATSCAEHRREGMLSYPMKKCNIKKCGQLALYGYTKQLCCEEHKVDNMYNLVERKCVNCHLIDILDDKKHCQVCGEFKFKRVHLAKQKEVKNFLDVNKIKYDRYDRPVDTSCGRERPDFLFDCGTHMLVLEVDEDQHTDRNQECEETRMINLFYTMGMPTIFLRYNPDSYKGVKVGVAERKQVLLKWLKYCQTKKPKEKEYLRVLYLFFDGYDPHTVKMECLEVE